MGEGANRKLVLTAMIFAVAMTFIDQTIVALAIPELQKDLHLSATGTQWIINAYLLSLSALFAFGGRLADIAGHRRMVIIGVLMFAGASALCGATPTGSIAETWMIVFRVVQGAGGAIMFPAALAIVVGAYPVKERGKALAIFFGITGGLTAIGPFAGGYLTEWTWRAIFWVNIPVAIIALILIARAKLSDERHPAPMDWLGAGLIAAGMGLSVLGLQQSSVWGWGSAATWGCIIVGLVLLAGFVRHELSKANKYPLMRVRIFENRAFAVDNAVLFLLMIVFVPLFFFTSLYAQIALGEDASEAGLFLLVFFGGFAGGSQIGGRILDARGARHAVVPGCVVAAVGFFLWAGSLTHFDLGDQWIYILIAGAGVGLVLSPASTDALNRVPKTMYGEATGITQTVRNFGSSLGLAVLGTVLILQNKANIEESLGGFGIPKAAADRVANSLSQSGDSGGSIPGGGGAKAQAIFHAVQDDFAQSTRVVFYCMAGVMVVAFIVALIGMPAGKVEEVVEELGGEPDAAPAPSV